MAYPPNIAMGEEDDEASIREEIIPNQKMCRLCQNSAHLENWVWGYIRLADPEECGYRNNIFNAAIVSLLCETIDNSSNV